MAQHEFLEHLKKDHDEQKAIAQRLIEATDPDKRDQLRQELYAALYPHIMGEEASIFPRLEKERDEEVRDDALEGLQEHHVAKMVLRELMELSTSGPVFKAKAKVVDELNRHHIDEEEENIFAHLRELCSDEELSRLFEQYEKAEEEAKP